MQSNYRIISMKYVIFLILIVCIIFIVISFDKKIAILKKQLLVANNQNTSLRVKIANYSSDREYLEIKYLMCTNNMGLINSNCNVFIAPLRSSCILNKSPVKMEVKLLDKAQIKGENWYYVSLPLDSNINSRGWVNENDFVSFYNSSTNIVKNF